MILSFGQRTAGRWQGRGHSVPAERHPSAAIALWFCIRRMQISLPQRCQPSTPDSPRTREFRTPPHGGSFHPPLAGWFRGPELGRYSLRSSPTQGSFPCMVVNDSPCLSFRHENVYAHWPPSGAEGEGNHKPYAPLRLTAKATIAPTAETAGTGMGMTVSGKMREIIGNAF
jgi:hypothetical protein